MDGQQLAAVITAGAGLVTALGGAWAAARQGRREALARCEEQAQAQDRWRRGALRHMGVLERMLWGARIEVPVRPDEMLL